MSFGRLHFDRSSGRKLESLPWYLRVPSEPYSDPNHVGEVYDFLINNHETFGLRLPSLLLAVTGDAGPPTNLRPQYMDTFTAGYGRARAHEFVCECVSECVNLCGWVCERV